jgi:hypothetical protein
MAKDTFSDDYQTVAERIAIFREKYPEGSLRPLDPARPYQLLEAAGGKQYIAVVAAAHRTPDDPAPGVGMAWEQVPGTTEYTRGSELMNAETSAWGRAIIAVLAADSKRIASAEEVAQAKDRRDGQPAAAPEPAMPPAGAVENKVAPQVHDASADESTRALVEHAMSRMAEEATTPDEIRDIWKVLHQAGLLSRRVDPIDGTIPAEGDGKVPIGELVKAVGSAKKAVGA